MMTSIYVAAGPAVHVMAIVTMVPFAYVFGVIPAGIAGWLFAVWDRVDFMRAPRLMGASVIGMVVSLVWWSMLPAWALLTTHVWPNGWGLGWLPLAGGVAAGCCSLTWAAEVRSD